MIFYGMSRDMKVMDGSVRIYGIATSVAVWEHPAASSGLLGAHVMNRKARNGLACSQTTTTRVSTT